MRSRLLAAALVAALLLSACTDDTEPKPAGPDPGETWSTIDPAEAGFKPDVLTAIDRRLQAAGSTCVAIVRDGKLVHDTYFHGGDEEKPAPAFSITKSFTSILVGMAVDDGDLALDDRASKYIPEWRGTDSEDVTIRDILANVSGRHWDFATDYNRMAFSEPDKTTFAVGLGQDEPPGTVWRYNNSAIQTLQPILEKATGLEPADMGQQRIFDAIDMNHSTWALDEAGNSMTFSGISSTCLDLARFGQLMLNRGTWNGKRLVSADYVEEATGGKASDLNAAYGLLWWVNDKGDNQGAAEAFGGETGESEQQLAPHAPDDAFWAFGAGRQLIAVIPSEDIVAVRMGPAPGIAGGVTPDSFTGAVVDALR